MEEEENDNDDFAQPSVIPEKPSTPTRLCEIVANSMVAQVTRTSAEKDANLHMLVGDLPKELRKRRALQERCWTSEKSHVSEYYIPAPSGGDNLIVLGTNGCVVFAIAVQPGNAYLEAHAMLACNSAKASWQQRIKDLRLRRHALDLREYIEAIGRKDIHLATAAAACVQRIDKLIPLLPEVIPPAKMVPPTPAQRPGTSAPQVLLYDIKTPTVIKLQEAEEAAASDVFVIWTCNALDRKSRWAASRRDPIVVRRGTFPSLAFNETHVAIIWQSNVVGATGLWLVLHDLTAIGRIAKKPLFCWELSFMEAEGFINDGQGIISASLSNQGILCVACSNAVLICTVLGKQAGHTRAVVLKCDYKRNITCARLCELDMLVIGTACGECYEIDWRHKSSEEDTVFAPQVEHILACEPIYDAYTSNRRLLLQTTLAMSGRLLPYICQDFVYMPSGRILASAVCGTLIFALEKYGQLLVYTSTARSIMYPFRAPPDVLGYDGGAAPSLVAYPGVHASCERVVVVYPGGLVRVLQIAPKMARKIAMTKETY
jgi:hypothetical protein